MKATVAVTTHTPAAATVLDGLGAGWRRAAEAELRGEAAPGVQVRVLGGPVDRIVLASGAVDGLAHFASAPRLPNTAYVCVPWRNGAAGRRLAVAAVQRLVARLPDRRVSAQREAKRWERDEGRAAGVPVTILTDAPTAAEQQVARGLAIALKMVGVRVHGLPAPHSTWGDELRRVLAAVPGWRAA